MADLTQAQTEKFTMKTVQRFKAFLRGERGVSALEYAVLVGVIAVAVVGLLTAFSDQISTAMNNIGTRLVGAPGVGAAPSPSA